MVTTEMTLVSKTAPEFGPTPEPWTQLEATCRSEALTPLETTLEQRVLGQPDATRALVRGFSRALSGLRDPHRPMLSALLLGPTGVGKTETARAFAEALFGSDRAITRIDCEEYAHGHEIAKLFGAPPGYVGHQVEPLLSQERIEAPHRRHRQRTEDEAVLADRLVRDDANVSVIVFDEIEKAHPSLWSALLGLLEEGTITLGNNEVTSFTRAVVLMTSNVGSRAVGDALSRRAVGFGGGSGAADIEQVVHEAARADFPLELLNRFDEVLVYRPLERATLERILDKFLDVLHERALNVAEVPLLLEVTDPARAWLVDQGTDPQLGARPLRRTVERALVDPLSDYIVAGAVQAGDVLRVELGDDRLVFWKSEGGGIVA